MLLIEKIIRYLPVILIFLFLTFSSPRVVSLEDRVSLLVNNRGFDFFSWTSTAIWKKFSHGSISSPRYFIQQNQKQLVLESIQITREIEKTNHEINLIYSNPDITAPEIAAQELIRQLSTLEARLDAISLFAEATLEMQVTKVLDDLGLTTAGQPIPWVLYHLSPLPQNLVISRRDKIETKTNYIVSTLPASEATKLEDLVDDQLDVSSLVVNIGGLAAYPTMIMQTNNLDWLSDTIAHEWIHIYLSQKPLGMNYTTQELRTMNETTASIAGNEIGEIVIKRFYPELLTRNTSSHFLVSHKTVSSNQTSFDFRSEMHTTRMEVDKLLEEGKIIQAENYMEERRNFFWDNGFPIRKLNQAYFAFHGSYADTPGGAAGEDPVGPAVRMLRSQSGSLKDFLDTISVMTSFAELKQAVGQ